MIERPWLKPRIAPAMQAVPLNCHYLARDYAGAITAFAWLDDSFAYFYLFLAASHAPLERSEAAQRPGAELEAHCPERVDVGGFVRLYCAMCRLPEDRE